MHEMDTEVGPHLAPSLFVFDLQLIFRDLCGKETMTGHLVTVAAPDFGQYLKVFEFQNSLHWLPSVTNIPSLLVIRVPAVPFQPRGLLPPIIQWQPHLVRREAPLLPPVPRPNVENWVVGFATRAATAVSPETLPSPRMSATVKWKKPSTWPEEER
jgi:hypothetical protein